MTLNRFEIEVESKIANLPQITSFIDDTLMRFQIDESTIHKVQLAVDEACANIIKHAYFGVAGPLKITLEVSGKEITIIIKDKGEPFDPSSVPPPDLSLDLDKRKIGGLGIHLIQKLMDSVSYSFSSDEGNQLVLRKSAKTSSG
jgi:serine/threonine-protein kinase RsbW